MFLKQKHVDTVCKPEDGETCSFLATNCHGSVCIKGGRLEGHIRTRIEEGTVVDRGDNCSGPHDFILPSDR